MVGEPFCNCVPNFEGGEIGINKELALVWKSQAILDEKYRCVNGVMGLPTAAQRDILNILNSIYCGSVNIDISYKDRDCYVRIK